MASDRSGPFEGCRPPHPPTPRVSSYSTTRAFIRPQQHNNTAAWAKSENKEAAVIHFLKSPLFFSSEGIIWAVERGNPYFARINFPRRFVRVMLQRVHHEKYICFPAAVPSKTAEGRRVDLLQPFVSLAWQRPLCQCKCGGASPPAHPRGLSPSFINNRDEPVAIGINAAFIRVLAARRG